MGEGRLEGREAKILCSWPQGVWEERAGPPGDPISQSGPGSPFHICREESNSKFKFKPDFSKCPPGSLLVGFKHIPLIPPGRIQ